MTNPYDPPEDDGTPPNRRGPTAVEIAVVMFAVAVFLVTVVLIANALDSGSFSPE